MSSFLDILTPESSVAYSSFSKAARPDTYEEILPRYTNTGGIINLVEESGKVVDTLAFDTSVNFTNWLDNYVEKIFKDAKEEERRLEADNITIEPSDTTSTQSTASSAFGLQKRWSSCTKKCSTKRHCTAGCYACRQYGSIRLCQK